MTHKIDGVMPRPAEAVTPSASATANRAGAARAAEVAPAPPADSLRLTGEAAGLQLLQRELGAAPAGIDVARVNQIRAALSDGTYRINPQEIASRLLALERELAR